MNRFNTFGTAVLMSTVLSAAAYGKMPTEKLVITGPAISGAMELTNPAATAAHVWMGNFVDADAEAPEPADDLPRYTVQFYVRRAPDDLRMVYVVHYVEIPGEQRGVVYFPGRGERWHRLNVSAIVRDPSFGHAPVDGRWYYADEDWSAALRRAFSAAPAA